MIFWHHPLLKNLRNIYLFTRLNKYGIKINPTKVFEEKVKFLNYLMLEEETRPFLFKKKKLR